MISTPRPMPEISRQMSRPSASFCSATMMLASVYQISEPTKIFCRPKRSARKPQTNVPMNSPVNSAAMKPATPLRPRKFELAGASTPALHQARRDIGGEQQIVEFEEHAGAEQQDRRPDGSGRRQSVDARRDLPSAQRRCCARHVPRPHLRGRRAASFTPIRRAHACVSNARLAAWVPGVTRLGAGQAPVRPSGRRWTLGRALRRSI